ncbi:bifunctional acetate--CoA ligase family protein/GNAT family N-acetyltransferase [Wenjunlia tyrosinilytica]|uniref:Acyl-CoA synthetase n=1 Tax=Wenjunlia tyrosinilytica TaxID=1544741 RepID=A0A917ZT57_9ACTN|nr:GNAT family N-acetyltransferase [Wenjunlia tyrosinilytica]GGO92105.1 acyl-CoA synthetase [Wenjunlia tyrosinilytica]
MADTTLSTATADALLSNGTIVRIRPARPRDRERVLRMHEEMSPENLRFRFFAVSRRAGERAAARVCTPRPGFLALLATVGSVVVGTAEFDASPGSPADSAPGRTSDPHTAEVALAVADDWHHRGIGTLLLEHLVGAARQAGIRAFTADALADNHAVLKVFADLGLRTSRRFEGTEVHLEVHLEPDESYLSAVDARGRVADVASMGPLLRPGSLAVVGAGRARGSVGREILENIREGGFTGTVYAVNPHADRVADVPSYPSVRLLPTVPDLVVVAVPAHLVPGVARECGEAGVRALVTVTSGLTPQQSAELLDACRTHSMRLVGPNCLGIANTARDVRLDATFAARRPLPGTAGVAVQSGGVGIALLGGLSRLGIGVSTFVSLGDKYDISGNDLLQWWEGEGGTDLAVLHLESFGNPRAFSRTARRVAHRLPVLTVDAGRSAAGRRAAASHTAAAATPTMTRQALFTQAGIIATSGIGDLLGTAALLHAQPLPEGGSVAVVSNAGGAGVLAADACVEAGLTVAPFDASLEAQLLADLPSGAAAANPVDTTASVGSAALRRCVDRLADHGGVDAVLVVLVPTAPTRATGDDPIRSLTGAPGHRSRTVAAVLLDQEPPVRLLPTTDGAAVPAYADPQGAAGALAHAAEYARWRSQPVGTVPTLSGVDRGAAAAVVEKYLAEHPRGGWLDPLTCADLLACYGLPQLPWSWVHDEEAAVEAARRLAGADGGAVLKAYCPGQVHKSEQGALRLGLDGDAQVRAAYRELADRFADVMTGMIVQPMAERGTELFAGVVQDEVFGPLVLFGLGGTATELLADHAARLAPLTDRDAHALMTGPRCAPLLFGYRGSAPLDLEALEQFLLRLSRMACDLPQLAEADFNPVVATAAGVAALDVRLRLVPQTGKDPYLRHLREWSGGGAPR